MGRSGKERIGPGGIGQDRAWHVRRGWEWKRKDRVGQAWFGMEGMGSERVGLARNGLAWFDKEMDGSDRTGTKYQNILFIK